MLKVPGESLQVNADVKGELRVEVLDERGLKMDRVRLGLIGAGWVARNRHLPALAGIPAAEVRKISSRRAENARQVAAEFEIPEVVPEWEELVQSPDLDGVVIATPPVLHLPATLAALAAGLATTYRPG